MGEAERFARAMCRAAGHDPDAGVVRGVPDVIRDGYLVPVTSFPAWMLWRREAEAVVAELASDD